MGKEKWSPICGHWFWDNQHGANTFCKKLGYLSGKQERANEKYGEKSIQIGRCNKDVDLTECTKKKGYCGAKDKVAIRITCADPTSDTLSSSCGGASVGGTTATATTGVIPTTVPTTAAEEHRNGTTATATTGVPPTTVPTTTAVVGDVNN